MWFFSPFLQIRAGLLALPLLLLAATPSPGQEKDPPATPPEKKEVGAAELPWTDSLAKGLTQSQKSRKPIFAVVGGKACPYCRQLEREMKKPEVQQELARWTLVALDADASPDDASSRIRGRPIRLPDAAISARRRWRRRFRPGGRGRRPAGQSHLPRHRDGLL